ncbi:PREDICTED: vomeronasal type-1 receptor 4-like [Chinchilla lanigera]|uniref:vomeronasal type-1 receptor 4-like n=1 Tax=Chinchilla lanigera TaxID=34839 RepID=UPI00038EAF9D|nr:PREDICTED: vomeronasal type-1 receptor 4-like [Chinchilla lanigera]
MTSKNFPMALVCLSYTIIGILGNFSLLYHYIFLYVTKCRIRATDQIIKHLVLANSLTILFRGVPETLAAFGLKDFLSDVGCKLVFYVHRVGRGVSIGSTCFLSVLQVITISPRNSKWADIKLTATKYVGIFNTLCWTLHMLLNIVVLMYMTDNWSNKNNTYKKEYGYCSGIRQQKAKTVLYAAMLSVPDVFCMGLMLWTSSSLVSILYRHKQRMQHIHKTNITYRSSLENRATRTIILLVSTFVYFYTLSSIFQAFFILYNNPIRFLQNMAAILTGLYPTISPFVLMKHYPRISSLLFLACEFHSIKILRLCFVPNLKKALIPHTFNGFLHKEKETLRSSAVAAAATIHGANLAEQGGTEGQGCVRTAAGVFGGGKEDLETCSSYLGIVIFFPVTDSGNTRRLRFRDFLALVG